MTFRVAQVSDSHLSRDKPFFVENFHVVAAALAASAPDLVVNTGDVSSDGATVEADLAEARPARGEGMRCVRALRPASSSRTRASPSMARRRSATSSIGSSAMAAVPAHLSA
jgi:3',5'-cyclic AMP phosphodiesterase CpdA